MTPRPSNRSSKFIRWLLPAGLLLVLVLGFLQLPGVQTRLNPDFLWIDQLQRLQKEEFKPERKLRDLTANLDSLKQGERPSLAELYLLKKITISVTNSLHFLDAMTANLSKEMQDELPRATPARRAQLHLYLQHVRTLQEYSRKHHQRLQELSQKVQRL